MQFDIYKVKSHNGHAVKDELTKNMEHLTNTLFEESDSYSVHSVIPLVQNGEVEESLVIMEKHFNEFLEVSFIDVTINEVVFEYRRANIQEILSVLKDSDECVIRNEIKNELYTVQYVKSKFEITNGIDHVEEVLKVFVNIVSCIKM
ncbi:hypothetical protein V7182_11920 [Neobacillus drentensis]|uniref:hypothetical protein n=1 Tax=Neobacillus drentensis TaxID=220684 RepID=UPI002FFDA691